MIQSLTSTLKSILDDSNGPQLVSQAEVAFERPSDSYNPSKTTINLFLYDIRENVDLRSNELLQDRVNGVVTMQRPPLRVACSYQVTAWTESSVTGDQAILLQHRLLGEALRVFSRMPTIDERFLQGELKTSSYPVSLVIAASDLVRNPAEFWSAMGGKLRPSFTLTATIAMDQDAAPITAPEVTSKQLVFKETASGLVESVNGIGGMVRDSASSLPLESADLSLVELRVNARTDRDGRFEFAGIPSGRYSLRAVKQGYTTKTRSVEVPGLSPTAFDIELTPSA